MRDDPFDRIVVPLASVEDGSQTGRAIAERFDAATVIAVNVVEKAGGAPDKASVEQREEYAGDAFDAFERELRESGVTLSTRVAYGTDVAEAIFEVAADEDADAIVFVPRGGSLWSQLLTGDVARRLLEETDRPLLALPGETE